MTHSKDFSKILNQMKYLMEYDTSMSHFDNQKKLLTEKPLLFPTSDKYSETQIAQIYSNNQIRKAGGGTMYVDADIKINDILPADGKNEGWTTFKNLTRDDGKPWSDEEYQKYLALPVINEFVESDGTQIKLYASKFKPKNPNDWNWSFSYLKKSDPNIKGKVTKINEPYDEKRPLRVYDWKKDDTSTPQFLEVKKINTEVTPGGYLEFKVTNPKNSLRILRIIDVNPIPGPYQATDPNPADEVSSKIFINKTYLQNWNKVFVSDESYRTLRKGLGYTISPAILFAYDEDAGPILKVESFFKGDILPGQSVRIKVKINDKFGAPNHEFLDGNILTGEPFYSRNWNGFHFKLSILTTEGEIEFNSRTKQSSIESRLSQNLSIVQNLIKNRLSIYNEFEVPDGFAPQCYDDFIKELYTQMTSTPDDSCKQHIEKFFSDPKVKQKYQFDMSRFEVRKGYPKVGVKCNLNAIKIIEKYDGGKTFPKGICPAQRKEYDDKSKEFKDELQDIKNRMVEIENSYQGSLNAMGDYEPSSEYLNNTEYQELNERKKQLESNIQGLVQYYGADTRSGFDRFMQEDFIWWQLGAVAVLLIISRGAAWPAFVATLSEATGVEAAVVAANVARFGAVATTLDIAANAAAGTYFIANDKTPEGMICFFFMALPVVHKLYPKLTRLFYDSEINIARQIGKILNGLKPGQIRTAADLEALALTMSAEQRAVFKKYAQNIVTEDIEVMMRLIGEQAVQKGSRVSLGYLKNFLLNTASFASTLAVDFLLIHELKEFYDSVVDQINMRHPGLIKTELQKKKIETYLNSLSPAGQQALALLLNLIQRKSDLNDALRAAMMLDLTSGRHPEVMKKAEELIINGLKQRISPEQDKKIGDQFTQLIKQMEEEAKKRIQQNQGNQIEFQKEEPVYYWKISVEVIGAPSVNYKSLMKKKPTYIYPTDTFLDLVNNDPEEFSKLEGIWDYKGNNEEVIKALNNTENFIDLTPNNKKDGVSRTIPN